MSARLKFSGDTGRGGIPNLRPSRPKRGDFTGCVHTRPLVDITIEFLAEHVREAARRGLTIDQNDGMLLIVESLAPSDIMPALLRSNLAFVGSDLHRWIIIPIQGASGLVSKADYPIIDENSDPPSDVLGLITNRDNRWGQGNVTRSFTPYMSVESDLTPEEQIFCRNGEALDFYRTFHSLGRSFVKHGERVTAHIGNTIAVLECDEIFENTFRYDELDRRIYIRRPLPWSMPGERFPRALASGQDSKLGAAWLATSSHKLEVSPAIMLDAIEVVAKMCVVQRVRDYLKVLRWDNVSRIGSHDSPDPGWLQRYFGATNEGKEGEYIRLVGRYTLMAAVARAFKPGCKVDTVLVLEGSAGKNKSKGLLALFDVANPDSVENETEGVSSVYKYQEIDFKDKDKYQQLDGAWAYEIQELDFVTRDSSINLKAYITNQVDHYRRSYAEGVEDYLRQGIFLATVNPSASRGWLNDLDGNTRRWWPVPVGRADINAIERDRDQIWAEAVFLWKQGAGDRYNKGKYTNNIVPIKSRFWTDIDDAYLWEDQGRKRIYSGDALVEQLRDFLCNPITDANEPGSYFERDVAAVVKYFETAGQTIDSPDYFLQPWRCLTQTLIIKELPGLTSKDGHRITRSLQELGFVHNVHAKVKQLCDNGSKRCAHLGTVEVEAKRRYLLYTLLQVSAQLGVRVADSNALTAIRNACFDPLQQVGKATELVGELRSGVDQLLVSTVSDQGISKPQAERLLKALGLLLGIDMLPKPIPPVGKPATRPTADAVQSDVQSSELD